MALKLPPEHIRVVSVGVGVYPSPKSSWFSATKWAQKLMSVQLLQKTLEINTQSMDKLQHPISAHSHCADQRHLRAAGNGDRYVRAQHD